MTRSSKKKLYEFCIPGEPVGKGRPRVTMHGTYTPKKTKEYMQLVRKYASDCPKFEGAVGMRIRSFFPVPVSYTKKKRTEIMHNLYCYTKKPDCDNVAKSIMDALNGIAYDDDSQVADMRIEKLYCYNYHKPHVEVIIYGIVEENENEN